MAHIALYREWRPQDFASVVGQSHIVRTLKNSLSSGRVAHAYLLCGPRGTGKTSLAKIFAKALNCRERETAEPCNRCGSCQRITAGSSLDVLEIDAASNRGIDEIRDLREKVKFAPTEGKYKVYIIDEVHMLTTEAFNALLKTLEEPPAHVIFLLATTEPHRLPLTILSRCQRFDFHRLTPDEIEMRLREVAVREEFDADEAALDLIARSAEGSLRDALGLLEQCAAFSGGNISGSDALSVLGIVDGETLFALADRVQAGDVGGSLQLIAAAIGGGRDIKDFVWGMLRHYRNLLLAVTCGATSDVIDCAAGDRERLAAQAARYSTDSLLQIIEILAETENALRWTTQPRVLLEITLLRLCRLTPNDTFTGLAARLAKLEAALTGGAETVSARTKAESDGKQQADIQAAVNPPEPAAAAATGGEAELPGASAEETGRRGAPEDTKQSVAVGSLEDIAQEWPRLLEIIRKTNRPVHAFLVEGQPVALDGNILRLNFKYNFHKGQIEKPENRAVVEQIIRNTLHLNLTLRCDVAPVPADWQSAEAEAGEAPEEVNDIDNKVLDIFGGQFID
ncbi:MAG: DNA polymerase III subunit gamma/tau [bacterium]|jgi:DNA polymerase-3 subunit gamma/tau